MKRIPLKERILPNYTDGEDSANMITHIVGGGIGVVTLLAVIIVSAWHRNVWGVVSGSIYGFTMIALFSVSSVYHGLRRGTAKKVMQVIDHCTIYFLIAGTYTPILLSLIRIYHPGLAWTIFGIEWGLTLLAATFNAIDLKKYSIFSMICYIVMGWCIIIAIPQTVRAMTTTGFLYLLSGGIAYTIGAVLYGIGAKRKYYHTVFHVFVDIGAVLQAISIIFFAI
ncbi:MAG: hemolysin III family protein [Clostridia bacterium]|nr:hemolysin III family protein [Clostridia bacterium]